MKNPLVKAVPFCLALLALLSPAPGPAAGEASARALYLKARAALDMGDHERAAGFFRQALSLEPGNRLFWHELGGAYRLAERPGPAVSALRRAVRLDPENRESQFELGYTFLFFDRPALAREHFARLAAIFPGDEQVLLTLAEIYTDQRLFTRAARTYREYLENHPDRTLARYNYAVLLARTRRYRAALENLERVIGEAPGFHRAEALAAEIHRDTGALEEAAEIYRRLAAARPGDHAARLNLVSIYLERQDYPAALEILAEITPPPGNAAFLRTLGAVHYQASAFEQAASFLGKSAELEADHPETLFFLAVALDKAGRREEALEHLRRLIALDPEHHLALNYLGYSLLEMNGDLAEAGRLIMRAVRLEPDNGAYLDSLGWFYFKTGNLRFARYYLHRAARLETDPEIFEHLARLYREKGRLSLAEHYRRRALEIQENEEDRGL